MPKLHRFQLLMASSLLVIATSCEDSHGPVLSPGTPTVTKTSALITWTTEEPADSFVDYGFNAAYPHTYANLELVTEHSVMLSGLSPGRRYHYRLRSQDKLNNSSSTDDLTFDTDPPDFAYFPRATSRIETTSARINWATNLPATSVVQYGLTTAYDQTATVPGLTTDHSVNLAGLSASTTYHYQVTTTDQLNVTVQSPDQTFTTATAAPTGSLPLRVLIWNIFQCHLTDWDGIFGRTDCGLFATWIDQLYPDVAVLAKVKPKSSLDVIKARLEALQPGTTWSYVWAPNQPGGDDESEGNAILSRYPLGDFQFFQYRPSSTPGIATDYDVVVHATVSAGGKALHVFSTVVPYTTDLNQFEQTQAVISFLDTFPSPRLLGGTLNLQEAQSGAAIRASFDHSYSVASKYVGYTGNTDGRTSTNRTAAAFIEKGVPVSVDTYQVWDTRDMTTYCGEVKLHICQLGDQCTGACDSPFVDDSAVRPSRQIPLTVEYTLN